jgi:hypothetical protein
MCAHACPRCTECQNSSHHWIDNPDFGNDPAEAEDDVTASHVCKHCPAVGDECDECDGEGRGEFAGYDEDGDAEFDNCEVCDGEGVVARAEAHR